MDGTGTIKDSSAEQQGTSDGGKGTSEATFTKAQVDAEIQKAKSDALAKAGRDAKSLKEKEDALKAREDKVSQFEREREESENEQYRDKPDEFKMLQEKRKIKQERDEVARLKAEAEAEKADNAEKLAKAAESELEVIVWKAAQAKGLEPDDLKDACVEFGITTEEKILKLAERLATSKKANDDLRLDSNRGSGGGNNEDLSPREKIDLGIKKLKKK